MLVCQRANNGINHHKPLVIRNSLAHPPYLTGLVGLAYEESPFECLEVRSARGEFQADQTGGLRLV